jgi:hypothetical protein
LAVKVSPPVTAPSTLHHGPGVDGQRAAAAAHPLGQNQRAAGGDDQTGIGQGGGLLAGQGSKAGNGTGVVEAGVGEGSAAQGHQTRVGEGGQQRIRVEGRPVQHIQGAPGGDGGQAVLDIGETGSVAEPHEHAAARQSNGRGIDGNRPAGCVDASP